jgi:hypothetical protein
VTEVSYKYDLTIFSCNMKSHLLDRQLHINVCMNVAVMGWILTTFVTRSLCCFEQHYCGHMLSKFSLLPSTASQPRVQFWSNLGWEVCHLISEQMNITVVFFDVMPYSLIDRQQLWGFCFLHLQDGTFLFCNILGSNFSKNLISNFVPSRFSVVFPCFSI